MFEYWHSGWHMWWMATSWVLGLLMAAFFVWAWVHGTAFDGADPQSNTPESILKRRYAQGDITTEEYDRRLVELRK